MEEIEIKGRIIQADHYIQTNGEGVSRIEVLSFKKCYVVNLSDNLADTVRMNAEIGTYLTISGKLVVNKWYKSDGSSVQAEYIEARKVEVWND